MNEGSGRSGRVKDGKPVRPYKACDTCRHRKVKCVVPDGEDVCEFCRRNKLSCTYSLMSTKQLGSTRGSNFKKLEERLHRMEEMISTASRETSGSSTPSQDNQSDSSGNQPQKISRRRRDWWPEQLETFSYSGKRDARVCGGFQEWEKVVESTRALEDPSSSAQSVALVRPGDVMISPEAPLPMHTAHMVADVEGESADHLVELYFRYVNPGFPVLDEGRFRNMHAANRMASSRLLLNAMFALSALHYTDKELSENDEERAYPFFRAARVCALLLLSRRCRMTRLKGSSTAQSIVYLSNAIRMAHHLELNRDCRDWGLDEGCQDDRSRAWAMCYVMDTYASISYDRPFQIDNDDCDDHAVPLPMNATDPSAANRDFGDYVYLYSLYRLIHTILKIHVPSSGDIVVTLNTAIETWRTRLPARLMFNDHQSDEEWLGPAEDYGVPWFLHITMHWAAVILHRPLLREEQANLRMPSAVICSTSAQRISELSPRALNDRHRILTFDLAFLPNMYAAFTHVINVQSDNAEFHEQGCAGLKNCTTTLGLYEWRGGMRGGASGFGLRQTFEQLLEKFEKRSPGQGTDYDEMTEDYDEYASASPYSDAAESDYYWENISGTTTPIHGFSPGSSPIIGAMPALFPMMQEQEQFVYNFEPPVFENQFFINSPGVHVAPPEPSMVVTIPDHGPEPVRMPQLAAGGVYSMQAPDPFGGPLARPPHDTAPGFAAPTSPQRTRGGQQFHPYRHARGRGMRGD